MLSFIINLVNTTIHKENTHFTFGNIIHKLYDDGIKIHIRANCAIFGCSNVNIFHYLQFLGKDEYFIEWSRKLIDVIAKAKVIDRKLRQLIERKRLWICERHYLPNQMLHRKYY